MSMSPQEQLVPEAVHISYILFLHISALAESGIAGSSMT